MERFYGNPIIGVWSLTTSTGEALTLFPNELKVQIPGIYWLPYIMENGEEVTWPCYLDPNSSNFIKLIYDEEE